jgi:hypothetical protein
VPGLAQMLGVPGMHVNEQGRLRVAPDDKTQRGMPDATQQAFIDAAMVEAVKQYKIIPDNERAPRILDNKHLRRAMACGRC